MRQTIIVRPEQYRALLERSAKDWSRKTARYYVEFAPYPRDPWVIRDAGKRRAVPTTDGRGFLHYDSAERAQRIADRLNRQDR